MKAFMKKEWMEAVRTGRCVFLLLIFVLFGIMNPAIAKLTPWMMQVMSGSLAEAGFVVTEVTVDAMTSWVQFYKNIPMALIIFVLLVSGSLTAEYQKGTLIPVVTKGFSRKKILASKIMVTAGLWTVGYFVCYGITLCYNAYFWDNSIAAHYVLGAVYYWMFGLWVTVLLFFFSSVAQTGIQVLLGTGLTVCVLYVGAMFPVLSDYMPTKLMDQMALIHGTCDPGSYTFAVLTACLSAVVLLILSVVCFDRRKL
ncbi:MAG: ABC transporter permease subunit [Candidatus Choladocola sp.]|nr:ABC transporter permease subunit [Candidatus Choladocola sp.]